MTQFLDEQRRAIILRHAKDISTPMPQLEDLKKNLVTMTPDELRQRIAEIREDRKLRKVAPKAKKEKVKTKESARTSALALLQGLSDAEKEALLAQLGE